MAADVRYLVRRMIGGPYTLPLQSPGQPPADAAPVRRLLASTVRWWGIGVITDATEPVARSATRTAPERRRLRRLRPILLRWSCTRLPDAGAVQSPAARRSRAPRSPDRRRDSGLAGSTNRARDGGSARTVGELPSPSMTRPRAQAGAPTVRGGEPSKDRSESRVGRVGRQACPCRPRRGGGLVGAAIRGGGYTGTEALDTSERRTGSKARVRRGCRSRSARSCGGCRWQGVIAGGWTASAQPVV